MKIYLDSIGCRLNQSEIEKFANQFRAAGHTIVDSSAEADYVVVNTCAVTSEAASDSRQKIRQAARSSAGRAAPGEIIVTGCWATLDERGAQALPGVTRVVKNDVKDRLVADLLSTRKKPLTWNPLLASPCRARICAHGLLSRCRMDVIITVLFASPGSLVGQGAAALLTKYCQTYILL